MNWRTVTDTFLFSIDNYYLRSVNNKAAGDLSETCWRPAGNQLGTHPSGFQAKVPNQSYFQPHFNVYLSGYVRSGNKVDLVCLLEPYLAQSLV